MKTTQKQRDQAKAWREANPERVKELRRQRYGRDKADPIALEKDRAASRAYAAGVRRKLRKLEWFCARFPEASAQWDASNPPNDKD